MKKPWYQTKKFYLTVIGCLGVIASQYFGLEINDKLIEACKAISETCAEVLK